MELTYLYHSGFVVETDRCVLVFDYWMDPANVMERLVNPCGDKHVYVFVSHFHRDHLTSTSSGGGRRTLAQPLPTCYRATSSTTIVPPRRLPTLGWRRATNGTTTTLA